jgi:hypothetical protein
VQLPFTTAKFFDVFRRYNEAVWPVQWILIALAVAGVTLAIRGSPHSGRIVSWLLASFWLWMAIARGARAGPPAATPAAGVRQPGATPT